MFSKNITLAGIVLSLFTIPAFGHHSFAMFDQTMHLNVRGTVTDFNWINPHAWIHVAVTDEDGNSVTWSFEASSTGRLAASGWSPDMVVAGDQIEVGFSPLRDGTPGGHVKTLILPDGTELCNGAECRERLGVE
jgi:hypothetical protein